MTSSTAPSFQSLEAFLASLKIQYFQWFTHMTLGFVFATV
jgi:hypothetical protein